MTPKAKKESSRRSLPNAGRKKLSCIYLPVMPKYWGGNYFAHGSFPEGGQKQKTEREKKKKQAGAELCQAQDKLSQAVLDCKLVYFDPARLG